MAVPHPCTLVVKVVIILFANELIEPAFAEGGAADKRNQSYSILPDAPKCYKMSHLMTVSAGLEADCAATCVGEACSVFQFNTAASECHLYSGQALGDPEEPQDDSPLFASENYHEQISDETGLLENGWLLFVRRQDGSVDFNRPWADYRCGFGNKDSEFWLGLETLHKLTADQPYKLRAEMTDWTDTEYFAEYTTFQVGAEGTAYILSVSGYDGTSTAGDAMTYHDGYKFSTLDVENDVCGCNCAVDYNGGWWYKNCHLAHPTGLYFPTTTLDNKGLMWHPVGALGVGYSFKEMKLMIKP